VGFLREHGQSSLIGPVFSAWSVGSLAGGLIVGAVHRRLSPAWLAAGLGLMTIPVGLVPTGQWLFAGVIFCGALCAPVLSVTAERISQLVSEAARGEAMGWFSTALAAGAALGAPLSGAAIDAWGPGYGFVLSGICGTVVAMGGVLWGRFNDQAPVGSFA
jgi:predicted MFS family arabinose efflux permease